MLTSSFESAVETDFLQIINENATTPKPILERWFNLPFEMYQSKGSFRTCNQVWNRTNIHSNNVFRHIRWTGRVTLNDEIDNLTDLNPSLRKINLNNCYFRELRKLPRFLQAFPMLEKIDTIGMYADVTLDEVHSFAVQSQNSQKFKFEFEADYDDDNHFKNININGWQTAIRYRTREYSRQKYQCFELTRVAKNISE